MRARPVAGSVVLALALAGLAPGAQGLAADESVAVDSLPAVPEGGLAGLRVAVVSHADGTDPVAVAAAELMGGLGAELVEGVLSDVDAIVLAGEGLDPVLLPAGADADALVIDLQDGPALAGKVAVRVDQVAADQLGGEMAARLAVERGDVIWANVGFSPDEDGDRVADAFDGSARVPEAAGMSIATSITDPAWGLDLSPMVTFGMAPVILTLEDEATQAIVGILLDAGRTSTDAAVVGVGCAAATRALLAADGGGLLRACIEASPEARADATSRVLLASMTGPVPPIVLVPPTARTQP